MWGSSLLGALVGDCRARQGQPEKGLAGFLIQPWAPAWGGCLMESQWACQWVHHDAEAVSAHQRLGGIDHYLHLAIEKTEARCSYTDWLLGLPSLLGPTLPLLRPAASSRGHPLLPWPWGHRVRSCFRLGSDVEANQKHHQPQNSFGELASSLLGLGNIFQI